MTASDGATTPILSGFYPDPSICRVGEDYYLVTSSFELFPGVPIWHSRDMVTWSQIGNILDRSSQLDLIRSSAGSDGVYAPTLRHHAGRFWMTTTVANSFERGPLIVSALDPSGPWTDPVYVDGLVGIDSDLVWDDDGTCHMTLSSYDAGAPRILSAPIDLESGRLLGEVREFWSGAGGLAPEAPHLYRHDGWWYLMLAEGGTAAGHAITMARAESLDGPWQPHPANPILTHRGLEHPVQYTGHGDLVETPDGEWAMVYLGVRLRGFPGFHVNGRESFIAAIDWRDGWPYVVEDHYRVPLTDHGVVDDFSLPLGPCWVSIGRDASQRLETTESRTSITAGEGEWDAFVGMRTRDDYWTATLEMETDHGSAALTLRLSDEHFIDIRATGDRREVVAASAGLKRVEAHPPATTDGTAHLFIRTVPASGNTLEQGPDTIEVGEIANGVPQVRYRLDGRHLSTEVAGGFTGRVVGVRALSGSVRVTRFTYTPEHNRTAASSVF